jgi:hypothetical protein
MRRANKNYNFTKIFCNLTRTDRRGEYGKNLGKLFPNFQNHLVKSFGILETGKTKLTLPKTAAKISVDA